jgi:hypothetical protein
MLPDAVRDRVEAYIRREAEKPIPDIAAMIGDSQARLLTCLAGVTAAESAVTTSDEPWSPRDLLRHVIASEDAVTHLVTHMARREAPPPRPGGIGMMIDDDARSYESLVDQFRESIATNASVVAALETQADTTMTRAHPWFGELNCREWAVFQRVHDEDHIRHAGKMVEAIRS